MDERSLLLDSRDGLSSDEGDMDDLEAQREVEEMLYSYVHYDDSSINPSGTNPESCVNQMQNDSLQPPVSVATLSEASQVQVPQTLSVSQKEFFYSTRPKRNASRYYDVNQDHCNRSPTFIAPRVPAMKKKHTAFTSKLLATSSNDKSYSPSTEKAENSNRTVSSTIVVDGPSQTEQELSHSPKTSDCSVSETVDTEEPACNANSSNIEATSDSTLDTIDGVSKESVEKPLTPKSSPNASNSKDSSEKALHEISPKRTNSQQSPEGGVLNRSASKRSQESTPKNLSGKKKRRQAFEADISKVLSSMLDEESQSSIDEATTVQTRASNALRSSSADVSGWSVGLSWDDMSSKFNFEVESSVDEESLCSVNVRGSSTPADSRTNTPDMGLREKIAESITGEQVTPVSSGDNNDDNDDAEDDTEQTRYQKTLKPVVVQNDSSDEGNHSDSGSEEDSVVEVDIPPKPVPVFVDLSDGDEKPSRKTCELESDKKTPETDVDEITVLYTGLARGSMASASKGSCSPQILSSDDDVIVIDTPHPTAGSKNLNVTGKSAKTCKSKKKEHKERKSQPTAAMQSTSKPTMDEWLYDPITSSQHLDHQKYLDAMSDDPKLWKIIPADLFGQKRKGTRQKCSNCNQIGHSRKSCKEPVKVIMCHMCGKPGHMEGRCPEKMCLRCGKPNNVYTAQCKVCANQRTVSCKICNLKGHNWDVCPDLWRRYHVTSAPGEIQKPESNDRRSPENYWCSNCASKGHLSHECSKFRWKCEAISPFIESYLSPSEEENKTGGPTVATMLLSDKDTELLQTPEGDEFLASLSTKCKATLQTSFENTFKKINIMASSLVQEEVREQILNWLKEKRRTDPEMQVNEPAETPNSVELKVKDPRSGRKLPTDQEKLVKFLECELHKLQRPTPVLPSVKKLYSKIQKYQNGAGTRKDLVRAAALSRQLNIILRGKCGLGNGNHNVSSLKALLAQLKLCKKKETAKIRGAIQGHYSPIFGGFLKKDTWKLIKLFDSDPKYSQMAGLSQGNKGCSGNIGNVTIVNELNSKVQNVVKNLKSRFITCKDLNTLVYLNKSLGTGDYTQKKADTIRRLIKKLSHTYNVPSL